MGVNNLTYGRKGLALTERFEGCRPTRTRPAYGPSGTVTPEPTSLQA